MCESIWSTRSPKPMDAGTHTRFPWWMREFIWRAGLRVREGVRRGLWLGRAKHVVQPGPGAHGATVIGRYEALTAMRDPEGNEFCVEPGPA